MIAVLAASLSISFPGGDVSLLAKSLSEATKQPVVFEAGAAESAPAFKYEVEDLNAMAKEVLAATGFRRAPGAQHVFHHGRLGAWNFGIGALGRLASHEGWRRVSQGLPEGFLKEGRVTFRSATGQAISLNMLPQNVLAKPVHVHWMLGGVGLKAWVENIPAQEFLNFAAKAVGGKLLQRQDRFVLDIDPSEIQRRAIATLSEAQKHRNYPRLSSRDRFEIELSRGALSGLGPAQVSQLLATSGGRLRFEISDAMRPAIYAYVTAVLNGTANEGEEERDSAAQVELLERIERGNQSQAREAQRVQRLALERVLAQRRERNETNRLMSVDPRIWGIAEMDARFRVTVQLATLPDRLGRQGPPVRLP